METAHDGAGSAPEGACEQQAQVPVGARSVLLLPQKLVSRKSASKWRGPAAVLDIGETGVTGKFLGKPSKLARHCVRKRVGPKAAGDADSNPVSARSDAIKVWPSSALGQREEGNSAKLAREDGVGKWRNGSARPSVDGAGAPRCPPALHRFRYLPPPHPSAQVPSSPSLSVRTPPRGLIS